MFHPTPQKIVSTNRLPLLIGTGVLVLVMGIFMYRAQVNQKVMTTTAKPRQSMDLAPKAVLNSWFNDEKFKNIKINKDSSKSHPPTGADTLTMMMSTAETSLRQQEIEDEYATQLEIKKIEDKNRLEEKQMQIQALKSPLSIDIPPPPGTLPLAEKKQRPHNEDTMGSVDALMQAVKSLAIGKSTAMASVAGSVFMDTNNQDVKQAFLNRFNQDGDYLEQTKKKPRSKYELKAGSYIAAVLITGINSDLPGNVGAQVMENVYDTVTGNYLLIPQGAKLIGTYNSQLSFGQKRVQVVWHRILFPDGQSLDIENMQGLDRAGFTGFYDKVDNHYLRIYGNAVLLSLMGAGYDILNQKAQQSTDPRETVAASVGQKMADVSGQALERHMNVQPTLMIDPGYIFKIMVMKDMVLENIVDAQGTRAYTR